MKLLNFLIMLILVSSISLSIVANSSFYTLGGMEQSLIGAKVNSSNYSMRVTQHYQQSVGEANSVNYDGFLKWLPGFIKSMLFGSTSRSYCLNSTTLVNYYEDRNGTQTEYVNCQFGCENGGCVGTGTLSNFVLLGVIALIFLAFLFIHIASKHYDDKNLLSLFFLLSLLFISLPLILIGVVFENVRGFERLTSIVLSIGTNNLWFFILVVLLFILLLIKKYWDDIRRML